MEVFLELKTEHPSILWKLNLSSGAKTLKFQFCEN